MPDLTTDHRLEAFLPRLTDLPAWAAGLDSQRRHWTKAKALHA